MFTKILVALDRSASNQQVFSEAIALAKAANASVMLLHVLSPEEEGSPDISLMREEYYPGLSSEIAEMHRQQWREFELQGLQMLKSRAEEAAAGVNAETQQIFGVPSRMICNLARTWGADLVVLGRRGHSGLQELFLGSVSNYVLHHAPCSVLTVQAGFKSTSSRQQQQSEVTL